MKNALWCLFLLCGSAIFLCATQAGAGQQTETSQVGRIAQTAQTVPVMDGGAGPCWLELQRVTTVDGAPVYDATIKVHIAYGFAGIRRLDLQAGTDADGKVKFIGLPLSSASTASRVPSF